MSVGPILTLVAGGNPKDAYGIPVTTYAETFEETQGTPRGDMIRHHAFTFRGCEKLPQVIFVEWQMTELAISVIVGTTKYAARHNQRLLIPYVKHVLPAGIAFMADLRGKFLTLWEAKMCNIFADPRGAALLVNIDELWMKNGPFASFRHFAIVRYLSEVMHPTPLGPLLWDAPQNQLMNIDRKIADVSKFTRAYGEYDKGDTKHDFALQNQQYQPTAPQGMRPHYATDISWLPGKLPKISMHGIELFPTLKDQLSEQVLIMFNGGRRILHTGLINLRRIVEVDARGPIRAML